MIDIKNVLDLFDLKNLDEKQFAFIQDLIKILTDDDKCLKVSEFPNSIILINKDVDISKLEFVVRTLVRVNILLKDNRPGITFTLKFTNSKDEKDLWEYMLWFVRFFAILEDVELSGIGKIETPGYVKAILESSYCPHKFDLTNFKYLHFYHSIFLDYQLE